VIGERDRLHTNAVKAAEKAGVKHITYTSMPSADTSPVVFAFEHNATEQAIASSTISHSTVLRNNWYFENLSEFNASTLQTNVWMTAAAQGIIAQISRKDLALAAATALVKAPEGKRTLTLNGPESLTNDEMATMIDSVLGTNINVMHVPDEEFKTQLESYNLPEGVVALITTMDIHNRNNYSAGTSNEFETLTGCKPQSFTAWLKDNRNTLMAVVNQK